MRGGVRDAGQTTNNKQTVKIELLSQWKLEAEFRKSGTLYSARKTWEVRSHRLDLAVGMQPGSEGGPRAPGKVQRM